MYLPGIFCAISLVLCGLYPVAMGAVPSPRSPVESRDAHELSELGSEAEVFELSSSGAHPHATAPARACPH